jgi:hypothetical protein
VKEGETAVTRDPQTGRTEYKRVQKTTVRTVGSLLSLALADRKTGKVVETITTTEEHPFQVAGQGFVPAGQLAIGNAIVTRAGPTLVVKSLTRRTQKQGYLVYNFEVEGDHTYCVGNSNGGAWVHNTCPQRTTQLHHVFPREFAAQWEELGIAYHEYTIPVETEFHQKWLHGLAPGSKGGIWNQTWRTFLADNPGATPQQLWDQMQEMRQIWGIDEFQHWLPYPPKYR